MRCKIFLLLFCLMMAQCLVNALDRAKDCKCRVLSQQRIVNGVESSNTYPWHLSLQLWNPYSDETSRPNRYKVEKNLCGAVLISNHWALTAGHCVSFNRFYPITKFRLGHSANDLVEILDKEQYLEIEDGFHHPKYNNRIKEGSRNDLYLIKLKEPVTFNATLQPACLPNVDTDIYDGNLTITGWGSLNALQGNMRRGMQSTTPARFLQEASTRDVSNTAAMCVGRKDEQICVNNNGDKSSPCKGDSGGPIHRTKNGKTTVLGVASWTMPDFNGDDFITCTGAAAYTRISTYIKWIEENVGADQYCVAE